MAKPAVTDLPLLEPIKDRWSPRAFADRPVETEKLRLVFEAARWAASAFNEQPWRYLVARKEEGEEFERILYCLVPGNQSWAKDAGVLVITVAKLAFEHNGKPNLHSYHDLGQASAGMAIQATALGLVMHQMGGFEADKAIETFGIPEGYYPVTAIAMGYQGDAADLPEKLRATETGPRARRDPADLVFAGKWGRAAGFLEG